MREIKIEGVKRVIQISDGKDKDIPFGMNGCGGKSIWLDGNRITTNGHVENTNCLDGEINYKDEEIKVNFSTERVLTIDDPKYNKVKEINFLTSDKCKEIPIKEKIETILLGLKYEYIAYINSGYRFGKELTFDNFCITFDGYQMVIYQQSHNGYMSPDYLELKNFEEGWDKIYSAIKKSIIKYFDLE